MYGHPDASFPTALNSADDSSTALALCRELGEDPPEWLELIPAGVLVGRDGREWVNNNPAGIVAAFAHNRASLPIDLEHATDKKGEKGEPAPAVGWIEEVEERSGAVWGRVAWNQEGKSLISSRAYRYYSPAFFYDPATNAVVGIKHAGLTNKPNLSLPALNRAGAHAPQPEKPTMDFSKIALALGLAAAAAENDILTAINRLKDDTATALNRAESPDADKFVPMETHQTALNRANDLQAKLDEQATAALNADIETAIEGALESGKIAPADREYYTAMCRVEDGLQKFKSFVESTPGVLPTQGQDKNKQPEGTATALNAEEQQVAKMLGLSTEDFVKSKQTLAEAVA